MKHLVPDAIFDQHIILLGKTRSGKSSVGRLFVEHLLDEGKPVCIVDPKGDWWGLKSSASGKEAGYKVVIFGGNHGDVPLNPKSGKEVAELAATENRPCIIDVGGWMPGDRTDFWIDFASRFFVLTRGRRWLVIDEVHNFCPKGKVLSPQAGMALYWSNRLASEGLGKGVSLIGMSQRPQKVHNDFLTSCETLIAMRVIHAADRGAYQDWIEECGSWQMGTHEQIELCKKETGHAQVDLTGFCRCRERIYLVNSLSQMHRGEAWVWSPEAGFGPKRVQFPMFSSYDSFKSQTANTPTKLKGWADVDLSEVTKRLEAVVKEAAANDPAKLKLQIAQLQKQLSAGTKNIPVGIKNTPTDTRAIERAVRDATRQIQPMRELLERAMKIIVKLNAIGFGGAEIKEEDVERAMRATVSEIRKLAKVALGAKARELEQLKIEAQNLLKSIERVTSKEPISVTVDVHKIPVGEIKQGRLPLAGPVERRIDGPTNAHPRPDTSLSNGDRPKGAALRILHALARFPNDYKQPKEIGILAGVSTKLSTWRAGLADIRRNGWVEESGAGMRITESGIDAAGDIPTDDGLLDLWRKKLKGKAREMLNVLVEDGGWMSKAQLCERVGIDPSISTYRSAMADLRKANVIEENGDEFRAAEGLT